MPEDPELAGLFDEANGHLALGELDDAVALYRRCVALDPEFFDGWHALGMALMKTGALKEAIGCGLKSVTLRPNDLLAWTSLSQMHVRDGNIPEAEAAKANARILSLGGKIVR
jgi:predicted Zn-dependent protease